MRNFRGFRACAVSSGLDICTELWALETYATYAERDLQADSNQQQTVAAPRRAGTNGCITSVLRG